MVMLFLYFNLVCSKGKLKKMACLLSLYIYQNITEEVMPQILVKKKFKKKKKEATFDKYHEDPESIDRKVLINRKRTRQ